MTDPNILARDQNHIPATGFESSTTPGLIISGKIDEITGRILVDNTGSGSGTVTSVSVVTANGISGSVATATTTPAVTLTLGAITPTSVNALTLASQAVGFTIAGGTTSKTLTVDTTVATSAQELIANKSTDTALGTSDTLYPSQKAVKTYADSLVTGLLDYRGAYDASVNTFPAAGGSGTAGAVLKGDMWILSVAGTLGGVAVQIGDSVIANVDTPGQTAGNWNILNSNISYVPEDVANKVTSISGASTDTQYPSAKLVYDQLALKAALAGSTGQVFSVSSLELGHASDTTITRVSAGVIAVEGVTIPTISSTSTLTNKRVTPRVSTATSYTTDTGTSLNCDTLDRFIVTAQAGALKLNNPTGTPTDGQVLFVAVTGTAARALTYDTQFEASTVALPTTTVTTARLNMLFVWRADTSKWVIIASA